MSVRSFVLAKSEGRKLSMVTCYDYTFAKLLARSNVDAILVGDSAGMVMHGHAATLQVTTEMMRMHTAAVAHGAGNKLVIADMPFLTCRKGIGIAMDTAHVLMAAGSHAVKVEGVDGHEDVIRHLTQSGIPVMGHLGMQPQSLHSYGGFRVQGRNGDDAKAIVKQATKLQELGAFSIVLECVPSGLAADITARVEIPTIGIGAGPDCDGQVLVLHDLLGLNTDFHPKFARAFAGGAACVVNAVAAFDTAVKTGTFPSSGESYS